MCEFGTGYGELEKKNRKLDFSNIHKMNLSASSYTRCSFHQSFMSILNQKYSLKNFINLAKRPDIYKFVATSF